MNIEQIRHYARYVVNGAALVLAVFALPEFGAVLPETALPVVASITAVLNTLLSWARRLT